jgi:hypothetical protein
MWAINGRSTHVHAVVTAARYSGKTVRDQLKANGTRGLRERWPQFRDRPVWTVGGDWVCINTEDDLEAACLYVREAQDRMEFEYQPPGASPRFENDSRAEPERKKTGR